MNYQTIAIEKLPKRFLDKIDKSGLCWNWMAYKNADGYGRFIVDGKVRFAHKVAFELLVNKVPNGKELDHLCRNRGCVNPDHLEIVSHEENVRRGNANFRKKWTHCLHGHPFNEKNTYITNAGKRRCRICCAVVQQRYRERKTNAL